MKMEMCVENQWSPIAQDGFIDYIKQNKPIMVIVKGNEITVVNKDGDSYFRADDDPLRWLRKASDIPVLDAAVH